ncbi:lysylphosphatidylglycerol synthase transmembrane domain-containing protein [Thermodesulfobacterium hydrogeniphilum]|uniref:lysylphosphatidylglycerol synthase transmembrane domain-containing protein n=1 Tax=Thermodesulfobacterium hydrogeniphilum TaxID=161156 RepID=UPI000570F6FE|nr:lysylphosphatidylglycerol synthase transmembrane domain-containing protein [Thermodesulfobacterium hydrogeniphilum]
MKNFKKFFFLFLRFFITFSILYFLFKKSDINKLKEIFKGITLPYYLIALLCFNCFQFLVALRWKKICEAWDFKTNYLFYLKSYLMGFSLNTAMPGIVGGDVLRTVFLTKKGLIWKKASLSVLYDRFCGLVGIFFILALFLPFYSNFLPSKLHFFLFLLTYGVIAGVILAGFILKKFTNSDYFKPLTFPYNLKPLFLGFVIQILFVLQFVFLGKALHLNLKFIYFFVIIPIISFLSALPLSISGLGVREGSLSYFLHLLNYSVEYGISLGLLGYSLILISALPGLYFYLKEKRLWK